MTERRKPTTTSNFGVGKRESHDASPFYARFTAPTLSNGDAPARPVKVDRIIHGNSKKMRHVADDSVALVVTSPPYFAGKQYEEELEREGVPSSYLEYLEMLEDVFRECTRTLEPGGRIAVNVANLGRKPYRSLSADVIAILQDRLGLLLRGEIIWKKAEGAAGSCAWGSFQSAANPVLRDLTERVVVASKGRFDRALERKDRAKSEWPSENSLSKEEFMDATTDLWEIPPESATRVGHPAPFPVLLPQRLIDLYTYRGDLVLDPFMGSGSTAVAAVRTHRHFMGYDTDQAYVKAAIARIEAERAGVSEPIVVLPATKGAKRATADGMTLEQAMRGGEKAPEFAKLLLAEAGFTGIADDKRRGASAVATFTARDALDHQWFFEVVGSFTTNRNGLRRADSLWRTLGKAAVLHEEFPDNTRLVVLTTDLPARNSVGASALRSAMSSKLVVDAIELLDPAACEQLRSYARGDAVPDPGAGAGDG